MEKEKEVIFSLLQCDVLKIGKFKLKSGVYTPIYIDLRRIVHYPNVVKDLAVAIRAKQLEENIKTDMICGVPYTALPIASVFSVLYNAPMIMKRKEAKNYGTKKLLEGIYKTGDSCLIIDDVVASGSSIIETAETLRKEGLMVEQCIVVVDKNQGGTENLKKAGITLYSLFPINSIFEIYCSINRLEQKLIQTVTSYFKENSYLPVYMDDSILPLSYTLRAKNSNHPVAKRLLEIMDEKKSNLCVAIDINSCDELLNLAEQLGPHICLLKTQVDILNDFSLEFIIELRKLSAMYNFLILEDRKFLDTGNITMQQYGSDLYKIQTWADLLTIHAMPETDTIKTLKSVSKSDKNACIIVDETNCENSLINTDDIKHILEVDESNSGFIIGYIAKQPHLKSKDLICMCSEKNVSLHDSLEAKYNLVENAVANGADIIIVGKDIYQATDVITSAIDFKTKCFSAYLNRTA